MMKTPAECMEQAEAAIYSYCQACGCETPIDVRKAGEALISKMARGIEKFSGSAQAVAVLNRTLLNIAKVEGPAS